MNANWRCSRCGCTGKHYNSNIAGYVCNQCGHPVDSYENEQVRANYDRAILNAKDHMRVGNWQECINIVEPVVNTRPADFRAYSVLLAALTSGYTDYLIQDIYKRNKAADCWDKLMALRKINAYMRDYQSKREQEIRQYYGDRMHLAITLFVIVGLMCLLLPTCCMISGTLSFFLLIAISGITVLNVKKNKPLEVLIKANYLKKTKLDNPFRYDV